MPDFWSAKTQSFSGRRDRGGNLGSGKIRWQRQRQPALHNFPYPLLSDLVPNAFKETPFTGAVIERSGNTQTPLICAVIQRSRNIWTPFTAAVIKKSSSSIPTTYSSSLLRNALLPISYYLRALLQLNYISVVLSSSVFSLTDSALSPPY